MLPLLKPKVFPENSGSSQENNIQSLGHSFVGYSKSHPTVPFFYFPAVGTKPKAALAIHFIFF